MRKLKVSKILISALLLAVTMAGCSDPDGRTGSPGDPLTPPTVTSQTPPNSASPICPNTAIITATFSKAMNGATFNTSTFTLTSAGASIAGQVSYIDASNTATFAPSASLAPSANFTATITTGVKDTFGNALAANFVWTFTTSAACPPPIGGAILLGAACSFGALGATPVVSSTGPTNVIGDVGIWPAQSITGFPPGLLTGVKHSGDNTAMTAQGNLTTAYNNAAGAPGGATLIADIGGLTLAPGVYKTTSAQPSLAITGNLTLSGNGVYIFQIVSSLTTAAGPGKSNVILAGGALPHDVFWQVGSSATLGSGSIFQGTIMANTSITLGTGAILNGRALAENGAVTLDSNPVNVPSCP